VGDGEVGIDGPDVDAVVPVGADVARDVADGAVTPDVAVAPDGPDAFEHAPATRAASRSAANTGGARYLLMERLLSREGTRAPGSARQVS